MERRVPVAGMTGPWYAVIFLQTRLTMKYQDYYKILGVDRNASQDEIKKAYRRSARKYHPDVSKEKNAEERFKELGEAYEVLKDPEKRSAYNQFGSDWKQGQEFRPPPSWNSGFSFTQSGDAGTFSDFFESLFGGAVGGRSPPPCCRRCDGAASAWRRSLTPPRSVPPATRPSTRRCRCSR